MEETQIYLLRIDGVPAIIRTEM